MSVDDRQRLQLHRRLETVLGTDEAETLMAHLPPVTWDEVATRTDVHEAQALTRAELRTEMAGLRAELHTEMADLRTELHTEMAALRTELRAEMAELGTELRLEMAELRTELRVGLTAVRTEIGAAAVTQLRWALGFFVGWSALMLAAIRFIIV